MNMTSVAMKSPNYKTYWELCTGTHTLPDKHCSPSIPLRIWAQLVNTYVMILSDHLHLIMHWFPDRNGVFQDDNATIHKGALVTL